MAERHDVNESVPERHKREAVNEKAVERVALAERARGRSELVIFGGLLILFCAIGWLLLGAQSDKIERQATSLEAFASDLRDANVRGCERQNKIRAAALGVRIRQDISDQRREIRVTKRTNPKLFPDIASAKFQQLIDRQVRRSRHRLDALRKQIKSTISADCEAAYPRPEGAPDS